MIYIVTEGSVVNGHAACMVSRMIIGVPSGLREIEVGNE